MRKIKIDFVDFWNNFDKYNNYFYNLLSKQFLIEISSNPDFLIFSSCGEAHLSYNCYKIFYSGENEKLNYNAFDFSFSFNYLNDHRNYRLPNWVMYDDPRKLTEKKNIEEIVASKTNFCNFIVSNQYAKKRIDFFHKLNKYRPVDSGGNVLNNIGSPVINKRAFISSYKFTIAFENSSAPGYTSEKIYEPMLENSIPIYWGDPLVGNEFNTKSFIHYNDFENENLLIEKIIELDTNTESYIKMLEEPWFVNNKIPTYLNENNIIDRFDYIFNNAFMHKPASQTNKSKIYYLNRFFKRFDSRLNRLIGYRNKYRS